MTADQPSPEPHRGVVFTERGRTFLVRCPACGRENWSPAVATGVCCWCGYDANPKPSPEPSDKRDFSP